MVFAESTVSMAHTHPPDSRLHDEQPASRDGYGTVTVCNRLQAARGFGGVTTTRLLPTSGSKGPPPACADKDTSHEVRHHRGHVT
eukprot:m.95082 g.95082  ORF g.95082 m.95082 type:complete len:85 (-) comp10086_c1_seq1:262-516(-)